MWKFEMFSAEFFNLGKILTGPGGVIKHAPPHTQQPLQTSILNPFLLGSLHNMAQIEGMLSLKQLQKRG